MLDVIIVGAGALGREVMEIAEAAYAGSAEYRLKGFLSDQPDDLEGFDIEYPILGPIHGYEVQPQDRFLMAVGSIRGKKQVAEYMMGQGAEFLTLISPQAIVSRLAVVGKGVVVYPFAFLGSHVQVGDFCLVNLYGTCGHDAVIGEYAEICPYAVVGGWCQVGRESMLAMHTVIASRRNIGANVKVSAGSTVLKDFPDRVLIEGVPGKVIREL